MDGRMDMVTPTFLCDLCGLEFYHQFSDDCVEPEWGAGGVVTVGDSVHRPVLTVTCSCSDLSVSVSVSGQQPELVKNVGDVEWNNRVHSSPPSPPPQTTYLLISQLEVVVGDPPVEVLRHILADFVQRLCSKFVLDAAVHAGRPVQHHVEEAQLREGVIERMLVLAPQPAADSGAAHLGLTAQRRLHVPHHIRVLPAVKRLNAAVVQEVIGLQETIGSGGRSHRGQQEH